MQEEEKIYITLEDADGKEHQAEVIDVIEVDDTEYVLVEAASLEGPAGDVFIFRFAQGVDGDELQAIEDEAEFNRVVEFLESLADECEIEE